MKTKNFKTLLIKILALGILFIYSCKPDDEFIIKQPSTEDPKDTTGVLVGKVTGIGLPEGNPENITIGPQGGIFISNDKRLKIEVPAGVFTTDQNIVVQPITNQNGPGIGRAYRITPHDITFAKPVKITFSFAGASVEISNQEALGIAYQDKNKIWKAIGGSELDAQNKTITISTIHFSDWSLFSALDLFPPVSNLNPGETTELELVSYLSEDIILPIPAGMEAPITERRDLSKYVKRWSLAGEGVLTPNGIKATYTAPSRIPAANPVAITLELNLPQKGKFLLARNMWIGREGVYLNVNDEEMFHMFASVKYLQAAGITELSGGTVVDGEHRALTIIWKGNVPIHTHHWAADLPLFNYNYAGRYMYLNSFKQDISPGTLKITSYGEVGGYVNGTFILEAAGLLDPQAPPGADPWLRKSRIEGFFRAKRTL